MLKILGLALALLWLPALAPAQEKDGAAGPAVFLLAAPESGPLAEMGLRARQGAELALNIWGGGYKLETLNESRPDSLDEIDLSTVVLVLGYFTEKRFVADAPRYLYLRKPVLLPFLTNEEAAARGPGLFFRLMPAARDQGRFLALEILKLQRRPGRLLLVTGAAPAQTDLVAALTATLAKPVRPPSAPGGGPEETSPSPGRAALSPGQAAATTKPGRAAPSPGQAAATTKPGRAAPSSGQAAATTNIKPLDPKAQVVILSLDQALEPEGLARFRRNKPDLAVLALDRDEALRLAPRLAKEGYEKIPLWGGAALGFREVGAGFISLNLSLRLGLPAANVLAQDKPATRDFTRQFIEVYKTRPTWISALAFDCLNLAVKAASSGEGKGAQGLAEFLAGGRHHGLASYDLGPEGDGSASLALMSVRPANLGFLP